MRLGSGEHHGWEKPRSVRLMAVVDGDLPGEFAWLQVPEGAPGGRLDVMVRPRERGGRWREPGPGSRVQLQSWTLHGDSLAEVELLVEQGQPWTWSPPRPAPDQWLFVEA